MENNCWKKEDKQKSRKNNQYGFQGNRLKIWKKQSFYNIFDEYEEVGKLLIKLEIENNCWNMMEKKVLWKNQEIGIVVWRGTDGKVWTSILHYHHYGNFVDFDKNGELCLKHCWNLRRECIIWFFQENG